MKCLSWILIAPIALLIGCYAQSKIYTDQVRDVNMATYASYAWLPAQDSTSSLIYDNEILHRNLMGEIDAQLLERGYVQNSKKPDLLVLMHLMFDQDTVVERYPIYGSYTYMYPRAYVIGGYGYYYYAYDQFDRVEGYGIDTVHYTEGTVIIDLIDAKTKKLVWRGWSERMITADNYKSNLTKDVKAIFKEFPVKKGNNANYSSMKPSSVKELQFYGLVGAWE